MSEIRVGMAVRDASGKKLGKVHRVYPTGFEVVRGFWSPYQWVFRHDEIMRVDGDGVEVARREGDLQRLAAGELPETWRRHALPFGRGVPSAPGETSAAQAASPAEPDEVTGPSREEERRSVLARGQPQPASDPAHH